MLCNCFSLYLQQVNKRLNNALVYCLSCLLTDIKIMEFMTETHVRSNWEIEDKTDVILSGCETSLVDIIVMVI